MRSAFAYDVQMEKKSKTSEISAAKWNSEYGKAWKHVVHWLSIKELANYRSISQTAYLITAGEDKGRVPWEVIPTMAGADISKEVWSAESKMEFARKTYRWLILHCSPFDPKGAFVVDTLRHAMFLRGSALSTDLFARLKNPTFYVFMLNADGVVMTTPVRDVWLRCRDCRCCVGTVNGQTWTIRPHPSIATELFVRAGCGNRCATWSQIMNFPRNAIAQSECTNDPVSGLPCMINDETKERTFPHCNLLAPEVCNGKEWTYPQLKYGSFGSLQDICEDYKPFNFSRVTIADFKAAEITQKA